MPSPRMVSGVTLPPSAARFREALGIMARPVVRTGSQDHGAVQVDVAVRTLAAYTGVPRLLLNQ